MVRHVIVFVRDSCFPANCVPKEFDLLYIYGPKDFDLLGGYLLKGPGLSCNRFYMDWHSPFMVLQKNFPSAI